MTVSEATGAPRMVVCLPTYNEVDNLGDMIAALSRVRGERDHVLVLDDASPDGTGDLAESLAASRPWLHVVHRPEKEGLGRAYLDGFRRSLAMGAELVIHMDCDFSHDPAELPRLVAAADAADVVIGSRYTTGGSVRHWPRSRLALSRAGSLYARAVLGLDVHDLTGGFKCFRREVLETVDLEDMRTAGYGFNVEMTYRAILAGFRVVEVPITFTDRVAGDSKMNYGIVIEAMRALPRLRLAAASGRLDGGWL